MSRQISLANCQLDSDPSLHGRPPTSAIFQLRPAHGGPVVPRGYSRSSVDAGESSNDSLSVAGRAERVGSFQIGESVRLRSHIHPACTRVNLGKDDIASTARAVLENLTSSRGDPADRRTLGAADVLLSN
jgi:hypothetical protein